MLSFVIGGLLGVLLGFALAWAPTLAALLEPYIRIGNALPRVVLAPIFLLWFGLGIWSKVALGVTVVFFIVFFNTYRGVREADVGMINNVRMLGASDAQVLRHVLVPSALTWIFSSLHISIGMAIVAVVVGEYLDASRGVGYLTAQAEGVFDTTGVFAGMAVLATTVLPSAVSSPAWSGGCCDGSRTGSLHPRDSSRACVARRRACEDSGPVRSRAIRRRRRAFSTRPSLSRLIQISVPAMPVPEFPA
jgi:ABC-type proline/glycine betaine transport system permease subunit